MSKHLNGMVGEIVGYVETSGRWRVKLPDGVKKNIKPANLTRCAIHPTAELASGGAKVAGGRGGGGKAKKANRIAGRGHHDQRQHVEQGQTKLVPPPNISFQEMLAKPGAIEMLKSHIGISPDQEIPLQILQQMESDYNEQQRRASNGSGGSASAMDPNEISSESDDESDLPSRLSRGWQPVEVVEMDLKAWMIQRGLDCFFSFGFGNTYGSLRKAGLSDAEIVCSVPECSGKRALSERNYDWCSKANGRRTALRYMSLTPEKSREAALAAGAKGWCASSLILLSSCLESLL
jgi:hypothetical protein